MTNMKYIRVGNTGAHSSVLAFGAMTFGTKNTMKLAGVDQELANRMVKGCIDAGINFFDTADVYDEGGSEMLLGNALKDYRDQVLLATKVRGKMGQGVNSVGLSKHHIEISVRKSLERLQTSWIDFYQFHSWDPYVPINESIEAMQRLVNQGKVLYPGVSNFSAWQMAYLQAKCEATGHSRYQTAQMNYSLLNRDIEHEVYPFLDYSGMTLLVWSPLHGGILSGKYDKDSSPASGTRMANRGGAWGKDTFPPFDFETGFLVVQKVKEIAKEQGATPSQISLAWLLSRKSIIILGAKTIDQLNENIAALDVNLTRQQLDDLNSMTQPKTMYPNWMIERQAHRGREFSKVE
jgi:aryl-alcohol dehydrogenase-like predicted oxidoreductase